MTPLQRSETQSRYSSGAERANHAALKLLGGAVLALVAWGVIVSLPDIKRYIRMSTM